MPLTFKMRAYVTPCARMGYESDNDAIYHTVIRTNQKLERLVGRDRDEFHREFKILPPTGDELRMQVVWTEKRT